jgi:iron-sulfur cluster assembly accessory protein
MKKKAPISKPFATRVKPPTAAQSLAARLGFSSPGKKTRPTIAVSEKALAALRRREWAKGDFMRIGVVAGGCSGQTYSAAVDDELFITDLVLYKSGPLRIVTDPKSATFLDGLQIDYSDDLIRSGFRFSNPNAGGGCGCGASFKANP